MNYVFDWVDMVNGGIFFGQLADGRYFQAANFDYYDHAVWFSDDDPGEFWESDDNDGLDDWVEYHATEELPASESTFFWEDLMQFCEEEGLL